MTIGFARRVAVFLVLFCAFAVAGMPTASAQEQEIQLCTDGSDPEWARDASTLMNQGSVDTAAEIYRAVLRVDPRDKCAVKGMAIVAKKAAEDAADKKSHPVVVGKQFDDWVAKYATPLTNLVLTVLGAAVILIVVARLMTRVVTGPNSRLAAVPVLRGLSLAGYALMVWALWLFGAAISQSSPAVGSEWVRMAVVAALGVLLVAVARGRALRLVIDVRGSSGSSDINASQYVAGRLGELGSEPPRNLHIPANTDVTSLPDEALSVLPESKVAKALVRIMQVVRPSVPWRAVICVHDSTTVTVAMTRNGRRAGPVTTLSQAALNLPTPAAAGETTTRQLLTAAAAHILVQLSKRHGQLRRGLCGTTESASLAMFAIATDPAQPVEPDEQRKLITAALAVDPANDLARAVDHYRLALKAEPEEQLAAAKAAERHHATIVGWKKQKQKGYEALRLRLLFLATGTRANAMLLRKDNLSTEERKSAVRDYLSVIKELVALLDRASGNTSMSSLVEGIRAAIYFQLETLITECHINWPPTFLITREESTRLKSGPLGGTGSYDRACWLSTTRSTQLGPDWRRLALDDLRVAVSDPRLRDWAYSDPSLANLRRNGTAIRADFSKVVGPAPATQ